VCVWVKVLCLGCRDVRERERERERVCVCVKKLNPKPEILNSTNGGMATRALESKSTELILNPKPETLNSTSGGIATRARLH
jgi:hypothetical protein